MTVEEYLENRPKALTLYRAVTKAIDAIGGSEVKVSKSQIAFRRRRGFAWLWRPDLYLRGDTPPLVLSIALARRCPSPRWKEVVEPAPGRFMHHLELYRTGQIDSELRSWLEEAWSRAA